MVYRVICQYVLYKIVDRFKYLVSTERYLSDFFIVDFFRSSRLSSPPLFLCSLGSAFTGVYHILFYICNGVIYVGAS